VDFVEDGTSTTQLLHQEAALELQRLLDRLKLLRQRLDVDLPAASGLVDELVEGVRAVRETEEQLVSHSTYLERLTAEQRRRYQDLFDRGADANEEEVRRLNAELERRIAERTRELTETGERLESVVQEMPQGVLIVDAGGKLQMANRRAEELTGLTAVELASVVEHEPWRMFARDGREIEPDERPLVRALATGEATLNERVHVERSDGTRFFFDFSAVPVRGPEGVHSVIVAFQDVTAQELRERAERNFVTNAAHELQTPIAAIMSGIQVLQAGAKNNESDRDRFLAHIAAACTRLDRLTRALLVLARAQAGEEDPLAELIEVGPLLRAVARALPPGASIDVSCPDDVAVIANRALLEQALVNLGANAVKYTNGRVLLAAERRNGRVRLEVRDEGEGIDAVERAHVFNRFYRGRNADDGFGLGLAIVAEAVHAIKGELELDSSDAGTGVSITLPAASIRHKR
jgi:two-component system, OmpR family, phosphate regulon sensor histidine kinase PhoR